MTPALLSQPQAPYAYGIILTGRFAPSVVQLDEQFRSIGLHRYNPLLDTLGRMERPWGVPKYRGVLFYSLSQAKAALVECLNPE
jgi:hypothetical protein